MFILIRRFYNNSWKIKSDVPYNVNHSHLAQLRHIDQPQLVTRRNYTKQEQ